ncbi:MAG: hypothetical protein JJT96_04990 [Opitutales bacterium]|nr:hypothetical protein [Opitutales bacterium]
MASLSSPGTYLIALGEGWRFFFCKGRFEQTICGLDTAQGEGANGRDSVRAPVRLRGCFAAHRRVVGSAFVNPGLRDGKNLAHE